MGRDERLNSREASVNPQTFIEREARKRTTRLLAEATAHVVGAVASTLIVTVREEGPDKPTFTTQGYTVWGESIQRYDLAARQLIADHHIQSAHNAFTEHAKDIQRQIELNKELLEQHAKTGAAIARGLAGDQAPTEDERDHVEQATRPGEEADDAAHE